MNNLAGSLIRNFEIKPDKVCLVQEGQKITYKNLYEKVVAFKHFMKEKGITKGSKVLVLVPMSIELYVTLISLWSIGAIPCFMDAGFIKSGMKNNDFDDIQAVIGIKKYLLYSYINRNLKRVKKRINVAQINSLHSEEKLEIEEVEESYPAIITYTSGSTGKPKIAERTHEFLRIQGEILEEYLNYEEKDVELSSVPIFTLSNINVGITTIIANANFTNLAKSNPQNLLIQLNYINRIMAAPGLLEVILNECKKRDQKFTNITKVFTGGGAVFVDLIRKIKEIFPNARIITLYGSTEAEPIAEQDVTELDDADIDQIRNGRGILAGNIIGVEECVLIDPSLIEIGSLTADEFEKIKTTGIGEIVVSGKNVLKGYVGGVGDKENKISVDGKIYHRTGDLGYIDNQGRLWLEGRKKSAFFNVEAALHSRTELGKTAIVKIEDKIYLVLEEKDRVSPEILHQIEFVKIESIIYVKKIPMDKRHSSKVDYNALYKIVSKKV